MNNQTEYYRQLNLPFIQSNVEGFDTIADLRKRLRNCPCEGIHHESVCSECVAFFLEKRVEFLKSKKDESVKFDSKLKEIGYETQIKKMNAELSKYKNMYSSVSTDLNTAQSEVKAARGIVTKLNNELKDAGLPDKMIQFHAGLLESNWKRRIDSQPGPSQTSSQSSSSTGVLPVSPSKRHRYVDSEFEHITIKDQITREYFEFALRNIAVEAKATVEDSLNLRQDKINKSILDAIANVQFEADGVYKQKVKDIGDTLTSIQTTQTAIKNTLAQNRPREMLTMARVVVEDLKETVNVQRLFMLPFASRRHPVVATQAEFDDLHDLFVSTARSGEYESNLNTPRLPKYTSFITNDRQPLGTLIMYEIDVQHFNRRHSPALDNQDHPDDNDTNDDADRDQVAPGGGQC